VFGRITRYKLGKVIAEKSDSAFPIGTFLINMIGAFLLGIVSSLGLNSNYYYLLGDGFLGAFTTFSTFMYEGFQLFRENEKLNSVAYFIITGVLGIIFYKLGANLSNYIN
jgi:CrcB protein